MTDFILEVLHCLHQAAVSCFPETCPVGKARCPEVIFEAHRGVAGTKQRQRVESFSQKITELFGPGKEGTDGEDLTGLQSGTEICEIGICRAAASDRRMMLFHPIPPRAIR